MEEVFNLEKYCIQYSIRMVCRVCNRKPPPKETIELVDPTSYIYGNIHCCGLWQLLQEKGKFLLCESCDAAIRRCAFNIYLMRGHSTFPREIGLKCRSCFSTVGLYLLNSKEDIEKYEILFRLVPRFNIELPICICKACEEVWQDLVELNVTISKTSEEMKSMHVEESLDNEMKSMHVEESLDNMVGSSQPIEILKPIPRLPVFQHSRNVQYPKAIEQNNKKPTILTRADAIKKWLAAKKNQNVNTGNRDDEDELIFGPMELESTPIIGAQCNKFQKHSTPSLLSIDSGSKNTPKAKGMLKIKHPQEYCL